MDDPIVTLVKAVYDDLQSHSFSQAARVIRSQRPNYDRKKDSELRLTVVLMTPQESVASRGANWLDVPIHVGIQKGLATCEPEEIDPLFALVREVRTFLRKSYRSIGFSFFGMQDIAYFVPDDINEKATFTSVTGFTYRTKIAVPQVP